MFCLIARIAHFGLQIAMMILESRRGARPGGCHLFRLQGLTQVHWLLHPGQGWEQHPPSGRGGQKQCQKKWEKPLTQPLRRSPPPPSRVFLQTEVSRALTFHHRGRRGWGNLCQELLHTLVTPTSNTGTGNNFHSEPNNNLNLHRVSALGSQVVTLGFLHSPHPKLLDNNSKFGRIKLLI